MNDGVFITNIAIAKKILGEDSSSFKLIEKNAELFEMMFPAVLEYVKNSSEKDKEDFIVAFKIITDLDQSELEENFSKFIHPVKLMRERLKI
jgi:hypothetical protein